MRAPEFWYPRAAQHKTLSGRLMETLLAPAAFATEHWSRWRRHHVRPARAACPVLCIGNLTVGGTGKTPVALAMAARLIAQGEKPFFLTRGYGGRAPGPLRVDPAHHTAAEVGDEALLLAASAPTIVCRDRPRGAALATAEGAGLIVMDDGFQNPSLIKDASLIVVDAATGFGNGKVLPAGPLRERVASGLARADAVIVMGADAGTPRLPDLEETDLPIFTARLVPQSAAPAPADRPVLAFAGIGRPQKFFATARRAGYRLVETRVFPDHHSYTAGDWAALSQRAEQLGAVLLTTEKDAIRLSPEQRRQVAVLKVAVQFDDPALLDRWLAAVRNADPSSFVPAVHGSPS